jgi:hypothetical protein
VWASTLAAWSRSTTAARPKPAESPCGPHGDRLVGKLDARGDRAAGVLRVAAVHRDVPFSNAMTAAVNREIRDLARWLDLEVVLPD